MSISAKIDMKKLEAKFKKAPEKVALQLGAGLRRVGERYFRHHKRERLSGQKGVVGIKTTKKGLGKTSLRSVKVSGGKKIADVRAVYEFRGGIVGGEHELGPTIRPKKSNFFILPMPDARSGGRGGSKVKPAALRLLRNTLRAREAAEFGFRLFAQSGKKRVRRKRLDTLFPIHARDGRVYLARSRKGQRPQLLFHLQSSVQMKRRLQFKHDGLWDAFRVSEGRKLLAQALKFAVVDVDKG